MTFAEQTELFENTQTEALKNVPEEFHAPMKQIAWEEHSYGYQAVLDKLDEIIEIFAEPIREYRTRLTVEVFLNELSD